MKSKLFFCVLVIFSLSNFCLHAWRFARWHTSMGEFTAEIRYDLMPITGSNFIQLTENNFYDNLIFHRVISGFVIQDGCPNGNGTGGPGYTIEDEYSPFLLHDRAGMLAMAKTNQPNSAGSQYYITLAPQPHLDGNYAVFGKVIEGLDVVHAIGNVPTGSNDMPLTDVVVDSLRMLSLEINFFIPEDSFVYIGDDNNTQFVVNSYDLFEQTIPQYEWYVDGIIQEGGQNGFFLPNFAKPGVYEIKCLIITQDISYPIIWNAEYTGTSTEDEVIVTSNLTLINSYPNPFSDTGFIHYRLGKNELIALHVYDIKGRIIERGMFERKDKGEHIWQWYNKNLPNGIYLFEIRTPSESQTVKKLIIK